MCPLQIALMLFSSPRPAMTPSRSTHAPRLPLRRRAVGMAAHAMRLGIARRLHLRAALAAESLVGAFDASLFAAATLMIAGHEASNPFRAIGLPRSRREMAGNASCTPASPGQGVPKTNQEEFMANQGGQGGRGGESGSQGQRGGQGDRGNQGGGSQGTGGSNPNREREESGRGKEPEFGSERGGQSGAGRTPGHRHAGERGRNGLARQDRRRHIGYRRRGRRERVARVFSQRGNEPAGPCARRFHFDQNLSSNPARAERPGAGYS